MCVYVCATGWLNYMTGFRWNLIFSLFTALLYPRSLERHDRQRMYVCMYAFELAAVTHTEDDRLTTRPI
jgi:hypothetical protein